MSLKRVEDWKELCLAQADPLEAVNLYDAVDRKTSWQSLSELMLWRTIDLRGRAPRLLRPGVQVAVQVDFK